MDGEKVLNFRFDDVAFPFVIGADERIISDTIEGTGVWEENQLCLYDALIPEAGTFVDVGANVGVNSLFAQQKRPRARVVAVEPEPKNFARLQRNCAVSAVETFNLAIADHRGSIGFAGTGTNAHIATDGEQNVPCDTMDSFVTSLGVDSIDLLKIDVEGFTDVVLSEAEQTLAMTASTIIEFSHGDILSRLKNLGLSQDQATAHSEGLFERLCPHFSHFYYISRFDGLVRLDETAELFEIMFSEATVGDVLATKKAMPSISAVAFAFRSIIELKRQNHLRILQIGELDQKQIARSS